MPTGLLAVALAGLIVVAGGTLGHLALPTTRSIAPSSAVQPPRLDPPRATPTEPRWVARDGAVPQTTSVLLRPAPRPAPPPLASPGGAAAIPLPAAAAPVPAAALDAPRLNEAVPAAIRRWEPLILRHAARNDVDPHLLAALMHVESAGREDAVSPKNAVGLMQVLDGPTDPDGNVARGAAILAGHLQTFGDLDLALAAYNAGPNAVRLHGGVPPYEETRWHVYLTRWWYWAYTR